MRIPIVTIIFGLIFSILIDWYILSDIRNHSARRNRNRNSWIYIATCIPLWIIFICVLSFPIRSYSFNILPVMWILYGYISIYAAKLVYCICSIVGRFINIFSNRFENYGAMIGIPIGFIVLCMMWWGAFYTRKQIQVNEVDVYSKKLPASFDNYRIVQFSDLHTGSWGKDTTFVSKLVDSINNIKPDLVVFTGDIVNRTTDELEPFLPVLRRIRAKDGVYSIRGNHDYGDYVDWDNVMERNSNNVRLGEWQKSIGWKLLDNTHVWIAKNNDSIALIGIENWGEPPFKQYGNLKIAYADKDGKSLYDNYYKILLSHNPVHWNKEVTKISNIDLTLSGHTHAMQMMINTDGFKWSPSSMRYKQWGGLYQSGDSIPLQLYVNIGSGEVGMPARIGATPEITVLRLRNRLTQNE